MGSTVTLSRLDRPDALYVGAHRMVVTQGTTFFLYKIPDYDFIGRFGRKGEGPREFRGRIDHVGISEDAIVVSSRQKVAFFALNGVFERELVTPARYGSRYTPLGENFAGAGLTFGEKLMYQTINIYDGRLEKIREVYRTRSPLQRSGKIKVFQAAFDFAVCGDRVFISGNEDFEIEVFDSAGKPLVPITRNYARINITAAHKREVYDYFRTLPETRPRFERIKQQLDFPSRFPAIRYVFADSHSVYVHTYNKVADKTEFLLFDSQGGFKRRVWLKVYEKNPVEANPMAFWHNRLYQLVETPGEEWELLITEF